MHHTTRAFHGQNIYYPPMLLPLHFFFCNWVGVAFYLLFQYLSNFSKERNHNYFILCLSIIYSSPEGNSNVILVLKVSTHNLSSVAHGWFSSILSFISRGSTLWHSLVFNQICMTYVTFSYPMKLRVMYACCSSVSGSPRKFCSDEIWLVYMVHACLM